jgi:cytochrome c oxidase assembly factor CtaG/polyferredoxin
MSDWPGMTTAWSFPAGSVALLAVSLASYLRGWVRLHRSDPRRWQPARAACFVGGIVALAVALWSPLDTLGAWLLSAHMAQHFLLAMVAPPLLLLGWPFQPMMAGLPRWLAAGVIGPIVGWSPFRRVAAALVDPRVAWMLAIGATWGWHLPPAYEWALADPWAHALEHACFLGTGVVFWWPVIEPWPWKGRWPRWTMAAYLLLADVANTVVAAALAFASAPVYRVYESTAPALGVPALVDQQRAAALMWLPGTLIFLVTAVVIVVRSLGRRGHPAPVPLPVLGAPRAPAARDRVPLVGLLARSPRARLALRLGTLALAALVVVDGFAGPDEAATNLAGTWPWTHWRGLAAVSVVAVGNVACMGCPLIAPRSLLRRWIRPRMRWPARLRSKWLAAALVLGWLAAYEAFAWWDSSALTAWLIVGLVGMATVIDLLFEGASFCQWVCPVGQWNMSMGVVSPTEVRALDASTCARCTTHDCLRGGPAGPGCGTSLFLPRKTGALECTMCLDCVTACPHGNAAVTWATPMRDFADESRRPVIGRWTERTDLAALLLVLGAGGIANALLMTEPAVAMVREVGGGLAAPIRAVMATLAVVAALALVPFVAAWVGSRIRGESTRERLARVVADLWPIGVATWLVHFGFHLVTGWRSAWPPLQRAAADGAGLDLGVPQWAAHCCASAPAWLLPAMLLALSAGLVASLHAAWRRTRGLPRRAFACVPDAMSALLWWAVAAWVALQPMEMRGLLA